jgi:hypothetical protein
MDGFGGPQTALTIALHGGLYLAIIMDRYVGPELYLLLPCMEASIYPL